MKEMLPFLRAIAATPEDDTPRLVFADWLDEHDLPDHAEFIRLQCELARTDPSDDGYAEKTARMYRCGILTRKGTLPFFDHLPDAKFRIGFRRGFIDAIATDHDCKDIDSSGFDLVPLQALRTTDALVEKFRGFTQLRWLEYLGHEATPARVLEVFGPEGWFPRLGTLCLPRFPTPCIAAGVIPRFELPELRNFFIGPDDFSSLGTWAEEDGDAEDEEDDEYYSRRRSWLGLPDYLPANVIPNARSPLERFVWHSDDDSDSYDDDWEWRGPTMEALLAALRHHKLKQVELAVDHDDHENGSEGVIAASYQRNPLELAPTLEHVTIESGAFGLLGRSDRTLKGLRVFGEYGIADELLTFLGRPVCSELESLHAEDRGWGRDSRVSASHTFPKLTSLHLSGLSLEHFANCSFPNLISLRCQDVKAVLARKWPRLQRLYLETDSDALPTLKSLALSDCCPNLTTLTIDGYFELAKTDISFLARCPHMPHLSLVRIGYRWSPHEFVVDAGRLLPVRPDVMLDELTPTTQFRLHAVF